MLEGCKSARERWEAYRKSLIDRWLNERQELIVLYCSINGMDQFHDDKRPVANKLKEMCQILVDYVSAGHFEVYEQLLQEGMEFNDGGIELAHSIFPRIERNTQVCLEFNDGCEAVSSVKMLNNTLSELGEALEERFMLEDQLIEVLHESHKDLVF